MLGTGSTDLFAHLADESITAARDRAHELWRIAPVAERPAQDRDGLVEVVLLDDRSRPDRFHQLVLADHAIAVLEQIDQHVVGPRGQAGNGAIGPGELLPKQVDPELSKPVGAEGGRVHSQLR